MSTRATATMILSLVVIPLIFIGPEQYGYSFIGLMNGLSAFAEMIGTQSSIWVLVFPLMTIFLMILFCTTTISTIGYLVIQIVGRPKSILNYRSARFIPMGFASCLVLGLTLFSALPGEPPIEASGTLFLFPSVLILVSSIHAFQRE